MPEKRNRFMTGLWFGLGLFVSFWVMFVIASGMSDVLVSATESAIEWLREVDGWL